MGSRIGNPAEAIRGLFSYMNVSSNKKDTMNVLKGLNSKKALAEMKTKIDALTKPV